MIDRRSALTLIASASTLGVPDLALAKEKHHHNGNALLGAKIKQNGKHKIHTAGKADVFAEVSNGKVVGISAAGMQVKKVKTRQKLAESSGVILAGMQLVQADVYYYGYWVYDPVGDYYYWFTSDVVIVDNTWTDYVA